MLQFAPISSIMTTHLVTVNPEENLLAVKELFASHSFHHLPVVRYKEIVGIISRTDFDAFCGHSIASGDDRFLGDLRLKRTTAAEIMTSKLAKVDPNDHINVALEVFTVNRFHALPVVENDELIGIITPFDIMKALLAQEPAAPHLAYDK